MGARPYTIEPPLAFYQVFPHHHEGILGHDNKVHPPYRWAHIGCGNLLKIGGCFIVPASRLRAYSLLQDPEILAQCMPGCDHLSRIADDEYEMKMAVSSVQGLFGGKVRLADQSPPDSFRLLVEGSGRAGFIKGEGLLTLAEVEATTEVTYDGEVQVGGMIAGVGQCLLDITAKLIIKKFFEKFNGIVESIDPQ
jgi:carbon monoxide dehydrogenase subunit G